MLITLLTGCAENEESQTDLNDDSAAQAEKKSEDVKKKESDFADESSEDNDKESDETNTESSKETNSRETNASSKSKEDDALSKFSAKEIEYARVWLQIGEIKDVDELNVRHITAGTPINPNDETSAAYPEDVIQLSGSRLVAGSVTYSGNGDGTINVYNVPLRWDGNYPAGEKFYRDIIESTELVSVDPRNGEEMISLISVISIE